MSDNVTVSITPGMPSIQVIIASRIVTTSAVIGVPGPAGVQGADGAAGAAGADGIGTLESVGALVNTATEKNIPIDADMLPLMDSEAGTVLKKLSWTNIKATLKTYLDTLYVTLANPLFVKVPAETLVPLGSGSGTRVVDVSAGSVFTATAAGACAWNITNAPPGSWSITIILTNGASGAQTYQIGGQAQTALWAGGAAGSNDTFSGAGVVDILQVFYPGSGSSVYLFLAGKDFKA